MPEASPHTPNPGQPNSRSTDAPSSGNQLPNDLEQLAVAIRNLPATHSRELQPLLEKVVESTTRRRRILTLVQDALSQLRLDMKYLMFDLEATRRERDDYKLKLEEWEK